jgi:hypothetical protein
VRILHHEPGIAQPRAEEGHFFFDADLNRFLGPHGGGVHLDHDLHVGELELFFHLLDPILVGLRHRLQNHAQGKLLRSLLAQPPSYVELLGKEEVHPVGPFGLRFDLPDGVPQALHGEPAPPQDAHAARLGDRYHQVDRSPRGLPDQRRSHTRGKDGVFDSQ